MLIHRVEIAFLSISCDLLRIEREQILLDLTCHKLTSDTSFTAKKKRRAERAFHVAKRTSYDKMAISLRAAS